jgi:hypothetical protein
LEENMFQHIFTNDSEQRNTPQDMRPITMLHYTTKITEGLANAWLQEKNYAAG